MTAAVASFFDNFSHWPPEDPASGRPETHGLASRGGYESSGKKSPEDQKKASGTFRSTTHRLSELAASRGPPPGHYESSLQPTAQTVHQNSAFRSATPRNFALSSSGNAPGPGSYEPATADRLSKHRRSPAPRAWSAAGTPRGERATTPSGPTVLAECPPLVVVPFDHETKAEYESIDWQGSQRGAPRLGQRRARSRGSKGRGPGATEDLEPERWFSASAPEKAARRQMLRQPVAQSSVFASKTARVVPVEESPAAAPGPGEYEDAACHKRGTHRSAWGTVGRFAAFDRERSNATSPKLGPGIYDNAAEAKEKLRAPPRKEAAVGFGGSGKCAHDVYVSRSTPGPGDYAPAAARDVGDEAAPGGFGSRVERAVPEIGPGGESARGAGSYAAVATSARQPATSQLRCGTPGAARAEPSVGEPWSAPSFVEEAGRERRQQPMTEGFLMTTSRFAENLGAVPGPGEYEPRHQPARPSGRSGSHDFGARARRFPEAVEVSASSGPSWRAGGATASVDSSVTGRAGPLLGLEVNGVRP